MLSFPAGNDRKGAAMAVKVRYRCDFCGRKLAQDDVMQFTITAVGAGARRLWSDGGVAHYHVDPCWPKVHGMIRFANRAARGIAEIPTIEEAPSTTVDGPP